MKKLVLAVAVGIIIAAFNTAVFAVPEVRQNSTTGNIEIAGIAKWEKNLVVEIVQEQSDGAGKISGEMVKNIVYFTDITQDIIEIPVKVEHKSKYTVIINAMTFEEKYQTDIICYNVESINEIFDAIVDENSDAETIRLLLEDEDARIMLEIDNDCYLAMTDEGRTAFAGLILTKKTSDIDEFKTLYDEKFPLYALNYAKDAESALSVVNKFTLYDSNILGGDDYNVMSDTEKKNVLSRLIGSGTLERESFEKLMSSAVLLESLGHIKGVTAVNPLLEKYKSLLGAAERYFGLSNTYSVDNAIAGKTFTLISDCTDEINNQIDLLNSKSNSSGGGSKGGSGGGGALPSTGITVNKQSDNAFSFTDLGDVLWASEAIYDLYDKKIVSGYGDGSFRPLDPVKREEFVKLLTLAFSEPVYDGELPFIDVDNNAWYYPYVLSGYTKNLIKGIDAPKFGTGSEITRQDMAVLIYRYLEYSGVELKKGNVLKFYDKAQISDYALDAVYALNESGIIKGMSDATFKPKQSCNRAEAAHVIYNALQYKASH